MTMPRGIPEYTNVRLNGVKGVNISGTTFSTNAFHISTNGINSFDAGFSVNTYCKVNSPE